jgi:hypothetical protein
MSRIEFSFIFRGVSYTTQEQECISLFIMYTIFIAAIPGGHEYQSVQF